MTVRIRGSHLPSGRATTDTPLHNSRSRGHRLGGFCGMVKEERAWIKVLDERKSDKV